MSDAVIIQVATSSITTLGLVIVAYINTHQNRKIAAKVDDYHKEVNGKMGELLKVTGEAENAKGFKKGKEEKNKSK